MSIPCRVLVGAVASLLHFAPCAAWAADNGASGAPQAGSTLAEAATDAPPGMRAETLRLWSGRAPLATGDDLLQTPSLTIVRPQAGRANGASVVIAPGGAYIGLSSLLEGLEPAAWFASRGFTAFVLTYRVRPAGGIHASLLDGTRAIRFVRAHAQELKVSPDRIGMMGFSAGGHLAASTAVGANPGEATDSDPVERVSSRPDFLILAYPWLEATKLNPDKSSSYCKFGAYLRPAPVCKAQDYVSLDPISHVTGQMPPTFIFHTTNDDVVPVTGAVRMYEALVSKNIDAELHIFASGPHGSGMGGTSGPALAAWPEMLDQWLQSHKYLGR